MSEISLMIGQDYPLTGPITYFEAYMFVTTTKHINEHGVVYDGVVVDGNKGVLPTGSFVVLQNRKNAVTLFNNALKSVLKNFPNANMVSCVLIDFDGDINDMQEVIKVTEMLKRLFVEWCQVNNRVGACVPHLDQNKRAPHMHFLYTKVRGKSSEFQDYLMTKLN